MDDSPATKADINQALAAFEERFTGKMRDLQTELLRAFHAWGRPIELRTAVLPIIEERLTLLENRVNRIERGGE